MKKIFLLSTFVFSFLLATAQEKGIQFDHSSFKELLDKATKENKLVFIDAYATWCGPCKWMAKNVFTNDTVANFYQSNFICAKIDMEKGEGPELAKKYNVQAYPTFLFINGNGDLIHQACGGVPTASFIDIGKNATNPKKQMAYYTKNFNSNTLSIDELHDYIYLLSAACSDNKKALETYFSTEKEENLLLPKNWRLIYNMSKDPESKEIQYLINNTTLFSKLYSKDSVSDKISQVHYVQLMEKLYKNDTIGYDKLKTKMRKQKAVDLNEPILRADIDYYLARKDWSYLTSTASTYIEKYHGDDSDILNSLGWTFYKNITDKKALETALGWSKHAVELNDNYAYNDTYAALLYKLERKKEARMAAERALMLAKQEGEDAKETEELLVKINALK